MLNKKLLAAAIVGTLAAGNAAAADLSASPAAAPAYFAKEIIASTAAPRTLTTSPAATNLNWKTGYNFSSGEVRYARVECSSNMKFGAGTTVAIDTATASIGSINGVNSSVMTFSVTSGSTLITQASRLTVTGNHAITGTDSPVNCTVGLYDQPSQAQTGGTTGLIPGSVFSGAYLAFAPSYELVVASPTTDVANVESNPAFSRFVPRLFGDLAAVVGYNATTNVKYQVRDPDGGTGQGAPYGINGAEVTLADLLSSDTVLEVQGDYSLIRSAGSTPYDAAARARTGFGYNASALTATKATFPVGANTQNTGLVLNKSAVPTNLINESEYVASLIVDAAQPSLYNVTDITGVNIGKIVRNGTQLQAPLAQVPGGWLSRLVLTNTGSLDRAYSIAVTGEAGNVISTDNLTGSVPANGTKVIDLVDVLKGFTGAPRATLNVTVSGPNNQIQGLYQIVNPDQGSVSNHVLVRPGTN